jgi:hypothetical protein
MGIRETLVNGPLGFGAAPLGNRAVKQLACPGYIGARHFAWMTEAPRAAGREVPARGSTDAMARVSR